jgi:hypothetical protein
MTSSLYIDRWSHPLCSVQRRFKSSLSFKLTYRIIWILQYCNMFLDLTFIWPCILIISIVKPTRCTIFKFIEYHSTCFGRSFLPSSGVKDCTHSIRYISYRLVECLLAGTRWNCLHFHLVPDSKQSANLYDISDVCSLKLLIMEGKTVRNM